MDAKKAHNCRARRRAVAPVALAAAGTALAMYLVAWASPVQAHSRWTWPMSDHVLLSRFDRPAKNWLPGHRGVDIAGRALDSVRSAGAGTVTFAGLVGAKSVVVVSHGSLRTTYEPVLASVVVGQQVTRGQEIGVLSPSASHCSPLGKVICLHWGLRRGKDYLNPLALVSNVRLLPTGKGS